MFPVEAFRSTVQKIVDIFQKHSIPFHLTGGVTSTAYGEPRMTQDIDIVIENEATANCLEAFLESLKQSDFMKSDAAIEQAIKSKGMFQLLDNAESLKLGKSQKSARLTSDLGILLRSSSGSNPLSRYLNATARTVERSDR